MISFSVVIPLYNKELYIGRAIASVLAQKVRDIEIIVVDDGSTDNGAEVARGFHEQRIRIIQQNNMGVSKARNVGIQNSVAQLIAFLDADDEWKPNFLESITQLIRNHPDAGLYATAYEKMRRNGNRVAARYKYIPPPPWEGILPNYFKSAAYGDPPVCSSAVCVPRKVFDKVGMFNESRRMGEDLDLWGRIALLYPVAFTWKTGAIYHEEAQNRACNVKFTEADEHPFIDTIRSMREEVQLAASKKEIDLYIGRLKLENARQHVLSGNYGRARQLLSSGVSTPSKIRKFLWSSHVNRLTHLAWQLKYKAYR